MNDPKPFASLSSGLLARKGAARPAMRPQGFGQAGAGLEDLGWNDMGFEPPRPAIVDRDPDHDAFGDDVVDHPRAVHPSGLTPIDSPVHSQQAQIAERLSDDENVDEDFDETAEIYQPEVDPAEQGEAPIAEPASVSALRLEPAPATAPALARELAVAPTLASRRAPRPRAASGSKGKAAFTLRLAPDRHLKLRLACAIRGHSAQQLVTQALDQFLESMPELDAMAEKADRKG